MAKNITIKQIAEIAGVSVSAVSFVLNGKKGVSIDTRERVLKVINENNYTPNVNSRRLILKRSFNILIAIELQNSPFNDFFYSSVMRYIVEYGSAYGYDTVLVPVTDSFSGSRLESALLEHNADGIIFLRDISEELRKNIEKTGIPFVVVDSQKSEPPYPCIRGDYVLASYLSTKHLIENGHKKIAFIGSKQIDDFYKSTYAGFCKAMAEYGLEINSEWVKSSAKDEVSARICMKEIIEAKNKPTAAFCAGDLFAVSAMNYLQTNGYLLPQDFSFSSIDDISLAHYHFPSLTTVHIDDETMAKRAVDMLVKLMNNQETVTDVIVQSDNLIIRNSVKNI